MRHLHGLTVVLPYPVLPKPAGLLGESTLVQRNVFNLDHSWDPPYRFRFNRHPITTFTVVASEAPRMTI
jgi:hypothetical protein